MYNRFLKAETLTDLLCWFLMLLLSVPVNSAFRQSNSTGGNTSFIQDRCSNHSILSMISLFDLTRRRHFSHILISSSYVEWELSRIVHLCPRCWIKKRKASRPVGNFAPSIPSVGKPINQTCWLLRDFDTIISIYWSYPFVSSCLYVVQWMNYYCLSN